MTEEEHQCRAMLLGMMYRKERNWYSSANVRGVHHRDIVRLDCVTLEVITPEEFNKRVGITK